MMCLFPISIKLFLLSFTHVSFTMLTLNTKSLSYIRHVSICNVYTRNVRCFNFNLSNLASVIGHLLCRGSWSASGQCGQTMVTWLVEPIQELEQWKGVQGLVFHLLFISTYLFFVGII